MNRKKIIRIIVVVLAVAALLAAGGCALWKNGFFEKINSVEALREVLPLVDLVLVMSVEPGFGGQKFLDNQMAKVRRLRDEITRRGLSTHIQVDGGVSPKTAHIVAEAGADVLVAGSAVYGAESPAQAIDQIRDKAAAAYRD